MRRRVAFVCVGLVLAVGSSRADWPPNGVHVASLPEAQLYPAVVAAADGGAFIAWDLADAQPRLTRILASGLVDARWPASGVHPDLLGEPFWPSPHFEMQPDGTGGVMLSTTSFLFGRSPRLFRVLEDGTSPAGWPAEPVVDDDPFFAAEADACTGPDGTGGWLVFHSFSEQLTEGLMLERISANGQTLLTSQTAGYGIVTTPPTRLRLIPVTGGGLVIWNGISLPRDNSDLTREDTNVLRVTSAGTIGAAISICNALGAQERVRGVPDGAGGAWIVWQDGRTVQNGLDVYAARLSSNGTRTAGIAADGNAVVTALAEQSAPVIASDGAGGAWIVWVDRRSGGADLWMMHVLASGARAPGFPVNGLPLCQASGDQLEPAVEADGDGGAFVIWKDRRAGNSDIFATRVDASGGIAFGWPLNGLPLCIATGEQQRPSLARTGFRTAIAAWEDHRTEPAQVYAQRVEAIGPVAALVSLVRAEATAAGVQLEWQWSATVDRVMLERRTSGGAWTQVGETALDGALRSVFLDADVRSGLDYDYRAHAFTADGDVWSPVVRVHVPELRFGVSAPVLCAANAALRITVSSPGNGRIRVQLLDAGGRRIRDADVEANSGDASLDWRAPDAAGVYFLEAAFGSERARRRIVVTR